MEPSELDSVDELRDILQRIEELRDEQEAKKDNIPESLQESEVANLLQERYDALDSAYGELERIIDELETSIEEIQQAKDNIQSLLEELSNVSLE